MDGEELSVVRRKAGVVQLPRQLLAPSKYRQYWIRYTFLGLASLWGGAWLFR